LDDITIIITGFTS